MTTAEPYPGSKARRLVMTDGAVAGLLEATSVELVPGEVVVAVGRPGHGNVALALALAGRLRLSAGSVELGGDPAPTPLQQAVVLVDVPGVTEPDDSVPFRVVVAEELALAGLSSGPRATSAWLREHRLGTSPRLRTEDVSPLERIRSLTELGSTRPDARFLVLLSPDRHGLHRRDWWPIAHAAADRGLGVLVTVSEAVDLDGDVARVAAIGGAA